ncbi:MAG: hypothetical protein WC967_11985, partial [Balneolaceae bacterium]
IEWAGRGVYQFPKTLIGEPKPAAFLGMATYIPEDTEGWIIKMYGQNWKTPVSTKEYGYNKNFITKRKI